MDAFLRNTLRPLISRLPYISQLRQQVLDAGEFPAGHFYSPIPSHDEVLAQIQAQPVNNGELRDIRLNHDRQLELLQKFETYYKELPFTEEEHPGCRYYYRQTTFCYPDAIFLYSFLRHLQPRQIIEVGSGFSSAVILDTADRFLENQPKITFIEPYPKNLKKILRSSDPARVRIIEDKVQTVPVSVFTSLNPGDLLFIDSSHVLKCGSDLQFLLFEVLPRLPVGIYVHFHDIFRFFEYPKNWLLKGWFWNEAYFLRAFLMNNNAWQICFFNNYVRQVFEGFLKEKMPLCLKDVGGSLYLYRNGE